MKTFINAFDITNDNDNDAKLTMSSFPVRHLFDAWIQKHYTVTLSKHSNTYNV